MKGRSHQRHVAAAATIAEASVDDLTWADAFGFGTPSRFGAPAAQLKHFIDQAVELWKDGRLANKPVTAFTSSFNRHGGSEATILSLANVFYHWGALIVPLAEITTQLLAGRRTTDAAITSRTA